MPRMLPSAVFTSAARATPRPPRPPDAMPPPADTEPAPAGAAPDAAAAEAALLNAARSGDRDALGELLTGYERRLFNVCLRMVGHRDDAAELTQDVLFKAVRGLHRFRGDSRLGTWLIRIAMNQCCSHLRKRKLRYAASLDADLPGTAALRLADSLPQRREPPAESGVQQKDDLRRLYAALAELDDDQRGVIVLRDIERMTYAEIGRALELPPGTVKSRLFRARLALRERLAPPA